VDSGACGAQQRCGCHGRGVLHGHNAQQVTEKVQMIKGG
jgi:hypothetical protein